MVWKSPLFVFLASVILFAAQGHATNTAKRPAPVKQSGVEFMNGPVPYSPSSFYTPSSSDHWLGGAGNWSNSGQWSAGLPGSGSDVVINTGNDNVTWDTSANINSLTLGGAGGSSTLNESVGGYDMNIAGALTVNHSGNLTLFSEGVGDTITANANSSNAGTISLGLNSTLQVNANFTNSGNLGLQGFYEVGFANLNVSGNLTNSGYLTDTETLTGNVNVGGTLQNSGLLSVNNLTVGGAITNSTLGQLVIENGGSAASVSNAGNLTDYNSFGTSGNLANSGTISIFYGGDGINGGELTVGGTLTNATTGVITMTGYPGVALNASTIANSGSIQLLGYGNLNANTITNSGVIATSNPYPNFIAVTGRFTNQTGGTLQLLATGGDIAQIANLVNQGTVIVGNTNTLTVPVSTNAAGNVLAGFQNSGSVLIQQGGTISSFGKYTQTAGQTTVDGHLEGIINFAGGSVYGNNGTISGSTTSNASINFGDAPLTVGQLNFAGNYTQGANGSLTFDIASLSSYDKMDITGQAHLNGMMTIDLLHGYVPQVGNMFEIMTFAGESGTFSNIAGLPINSQEHFTLQYNSSNLTLDVVSGPLAGLSALKTGSSSNEPFIQIAEAGSPSQMSMNGGSPQTTPEPGSIILFGSGVAGLIELMRRRRIQL
jgi:hypothetical protein